MMLLQMFYLKLLLASAVCVSTSQQATGFELAQISYGDLKASFHNNDVLLRLRTALGKDGIFAVSEVPRLKEARHQAFLSVSKCLIGDDLSASSGSSNPAGRSSLLEDGTERRSLASPIWGSLGGGRVPLLVEQQEQKQQMQSSPSECYDENASSSVDVNAATEELRTIVDRVSRALSSAMDEALLPIIDSTAADSTFALFRDETAVKSDTRNQHRQEQQQRQQQREPDDFGAHGRRWISFSDATTHGDQLEHFHAYISPTEEQRQRQQNYRNNMHNEHQLLRQRQQQQKSEFALEYHTDAGLFILFAPALYQVTGDKRKHHTLTSAPDRSEFRFIDGDGIEHALVVGNHDTSTGTATAASAADGIEGDELNNSVVDVVYVGEDSLVMMVGQGAEQWINPALQQRHSLQVGSDTAAATTTTGATTASTAADRVTAAPSLRAVPHALQWSASASSINSANTLSTDKGGSMDDDVANQGRISRLWYGRMFLPPADAFFPDPAAQQNGGHTFRELRLSVVTAQQQRGNSTVHKEFSYASVGCGLGRSMVPSNQQHNMHSSSSSSSHSSSSTSGTSSSMSPAAEQYLMGITLQSQEDCASGELWCWMDCMTIADYNITCPISEVTCVDNDGNPVNPDDTAPGVNHPGCPGVATDAWDDDGGFCKGSAITMYMQGFVSYVTGKYRTDGGSETPQCLALWFEEWELDTKTKFFWACIGCVLAGIVTESLSFVRREAKKAMRMHPVPAVVGYLVLITLYAAQLAMGYLDMLVAMTYQVELFVCIVLGLAFGHGIFAIYLTKGGLQRQNTTYGISTGNAMLAGGISGKMMNDALLEEKENDAVDPCCQYLHADD